jgi:hypothetical protein
VGPAKNYGFIRGVYLVPRSNDLLSATFGLIAGDATLAGLAIPGTILGIIGFDQRKNRGKIAPLYP